MIGQITATSADIRLKMDGSCELTFSLDKTHTNDAKQLVEDVKTLDKMVVTVDKQKKKRSLDANAYAWVLLGQIAKKINSTKENVYRKIIKDVGAYRIVPIEESAVDRWIEIWESNGIGWISVILSDSKIEGYKNVINYYGSSSYDTAEMSILVDEIVSECKALGIPTETRAELALLLERWGL